LVNSFVAVAHTFYDNHAVAIVFCIC